MATLEVHDGQGRVERVSISREQTTMFGSSPKCEVVLKGEGVLPFHGRLRWKEPPGRFKVDASPDAGYLLVNGTKMSASSFRQGDEVQVGDCRIFLISDLDGPAPRSQQEDKTRVQAPAFVAPPAPGTVIKRGSGRSGRTVEAEGAKRKDAGPSWENAPETAPIVALPAWKKFLVKYLPKGVAPGQESVMSSPLIFALASALLILCLIGYKLYGVIRTAAADRLFAKAVEMLDDGDYRNSILRFDEFLKANPEDKRVSKAKVHRAMANVRQYTGAAGASWEAALEAEKEMFEKVAEEPEYRDSEPELDDLILRTGEALADRSRVAADRKALALAEETVTLHNKVAPKANADTLLRKSRLPDKISEARAAVIKSEVRSKAIGAMDEALKGSSSVGVYAARDLLIATYSDQAKDRELIERVLKANDLIKKAVKRDETQRPGETTPHPDPFGPPTTFVMRSAEQGAPAPATADGPVVFATADGFAFGVDGVSGAPLWQTAIGLSSPFPPQAIPGGGVTTALAFDARHNELVRLKSRTGELVWRQPIGEAIVTPPLVLGNQIIQPTPKGKLLLLDLASGALRGTVNLGLPISGAPVADESGQTLYQTAEKDCMFVLSKETLACLSVEYLGHDPGSIPCPPARVGRYLMIPENNEVNQSRWRVFMLGEDGVKVTPVQDVPIAGWTWGTPASAGSVVWATADRGGVSAYAVGAYGEKDPFRLIASINADAEPSGPAFAFAKSERDLWVASGRSGRYELDTAGGKLRQSWTLREAGPALAPPQSIAGRLVLTQQYHEGPGASLWCLDPLTGVVKWRTVLGAAWPSPPQIADGGKDLTVLGADGRLVTLTPEALAKGGFVESTIPRPGLFRIPLGSLARVDGPGWSAVVPSARASKLLVRIGTEEFKEVPLPARVGAIPIAWGAELFVPGDDGRAYLIDPKTGESRAEPYVPPFDRTRPTRWRAPAALGPDAVVLADDAGRVRRLVRQTEPRPSLVVSAEATLGKPIEVDPVSTGEAVVLATTDGKVHSLSAKGLGPIGNWPLEAPLAVGPCSIGDTAFVADVAGGVLAIGRDGKKLWSAALEGGAIAAEPPSGSGEIVRFLTRDGVIHDRKLSDGSPAGKAPLGILPAGGTITLGKDLAVPVGLGTIRLVKPAS